MSLPRCAARARRARVAIAALALLACRPDSAVAPRETESVPVTINAALTADQQAIIAGMSVEVTGPGIAVPIVNVLDVAGATVNGTVAVTVGGNRRFVVRAYDATATETHAGEATMTVRPGSNPPLVITLYARSGGVPVVVTVGTFAIAFDAASVEVDVNASVTVQVTVTDGGAPVTAGVVRWGALDPTIIGLTPSPDGRSVQVTGLREGSTTLVASIGGVAAAVPVTVTAGAGPPPGGTPTAFREVAASAGFTCALDDRGAAWCWGLGYAGQLGIGYGVWSMPQPVAVTGGHTFVSITAGLAHACGVTAAGAAWCWGANDFGQLGDGVPATGGVGTPRRVAGGHAWRTLAAGHSSTCGITTAGEGLCWGAGTEGAIGMSGDGVHTEQLQPAPITAAAGPWQSLSLATHVSCGLRGQGEAVCSSASLSLVTTAGANAGGARWSALRVSSLRWEDDQMPSFSIVFTFTHACGISLQGNALCWGSAEHGELGIGTASSTGTTTPAPVLGGQGDWTAIDAGGGYSCGLRAQAPWCWGRNDWGQLGDGTRTPRHAPVAVAGAHAFVRIATGLTHACGIRQDGATFCWGANAFGEVGDGTTTTRDTPVRITAEAAP